MSSLLKPSANPNGVGPGFASSFRRAEPASRRDVRSDAAPAPMPLDRPAPAGVTAEPFQATRDGVVLRGELWLPAGAAGKVAVVVFLAGSGPTDRDCNQVSGLWTDAYRKLAEALAARGVASLRFDKRGVGRSIVGSLLDGLVLDDSVADAVAVVERVRADARVGLVVLLGHSEGGLVALLAAQRTPPDGLVLAATPGRPLGAVLREQLARQLDATTMVDVDRILDALRAGASLDPIPDVLGPVFRPGVRAFLRSEIDVDPIPRLRALDVPTAIVQGRHDAQVTVADALLLAAAREDAKVTLLPKMNHVFCDEPSPRLPQASYRDPRRPLSPGLVDAVVDAVATARRFVEHA